MSRAEFEEGCRGCQPAMIDMRTGKVMPDDSPEMIAVLKAWAETTPDERRAFHSVTCLNSRETLDLAIFKRVQMLITAAVRRLHAS